MNDQHKTKEQLIAELQTVRQRLKDSEKPKSQHQSIESILLALKETEAKLEAAQQLAEMSEKLARFPAENPAIKYFISDCQGEILKACDK